MSTASEWRFGIELECYLPGDRAFERGSYTSGRQIPDMPRGWVSKTDGSLGTEGYHEVGVEVVSPVLRGERGLTEVAYAVEVLLGPLGARVDGTTGLHVHVDASKLT